MVEKRNLPEIRFKGFIEEWEETQIGDIGSFYYGKSAPKWSLEEEAPTFCVRYGELYTKYGAVITKIFSRTNIERKKLLFSKGGEILVPRVGEKPEDFGRCCCYLTLGNIAIGEMISVFETTQNPLFYTYYFRKLYKQFAKVVEGKNVKNLYYVELEPLTIYRPLSQEQSQIGVFFQNIDNLIALHQAKHNKLVNLKKAMLEKMFPKNGADAPEIRFEGFEEKWEETKLGKIGNTYNGLSGKTKGDFGHGKGKYITYMNIFSNPVSNREITEPIEIDNNQNEVQFGDVFFTTSSETPEEVGMSSVWLENLQNVYLNSFCFGYRPILKMDSYFLAYMLRSSTFRKKITFLAQGISRYNISKNKVMEINIPIPNSNEQIMVGKFFQNLDNLISLHLKELVNLKNIKIACLEKMFV